MDENIEANKETSENTIERLIAEKYRMDKEIARLRRKLALAKRDIKEWMRIAGERGPMEK